MKTLIYMRDGVPCELLTQKEQFSTYESDHIFIEEESLKEAKEFDKMMKVVEEGDTILIYSLKAFGKTLRHLKRIMRIFKEKNIRLKSVDDQLDSEKIENNFYEIVEILEETNHFCCSLLTMQGIERAKEKGKLPGRPRISTSMMDRIVELRSQEKLSMRKIAKKCDISIGTVFKYLQQEDTVEQ